MCEMSTTVTSSISAYTSRSAPSQSHYLAALSAGLAIGLRPSFAVFTSQLTLLFFFFQAEDGIRDLTVTGVQTCALPICGALTEGVSIDQLQRPIDARRGLGHRSLFDVEQRQLREAMHVGCGVEHPGEAQIGRASCRERV